MKNFFVHRSSLWFAGALYALLLTACKDSTEPLVPASVQIVAGDQQSVSAGALAAVAPSVKVLSAKSKPVPGVQVTFTPAAESGTVTGGTQVTDANGVATVTSWTVGTKAGASTLNVTVTGIAPLVITATTTAGAASQLTVHAGDGQSTVVGARLAIAPAVRVTDAFGNAVAGVAVTFSAQNGGSVERTQAQSDADGIASAGGWTLGTRSGTQILSASATGLSANVTLAAVAIAEAASKLVITRQPTTANASGTAFTIQPQLEFRDRFDNLVTANSQAVTASVVVGTGTLTGNATANATAGRVSFINLGYTGSGAVQLRFSAQGVTEATSAAFDVPAVKPCAGPTLTLNYTVGQTARFTTDSNVMPRCFDFAAARNSNEQYLVLFENMSPRGSSSNGMFPGARLMGDDGILSVGVTTGPAGSQTPSLANVVNTIVPDNAVHGWEIGGKVAYEIEPRTPPGGAQPARIKRGGEWISMNSFAEPVVGDTLLVTMEGIQRLGVPLASQRVVVRLVSPDLVIAEDVRFETDTTFKRGTGTRNSPIADADLQAIAADYAAFARQQGDRFFTSIHNGSTAQNPGRPIAVHSMMFNDNVWGYTYSTTNYFVWDYWVNSNGSTKTVYQQSTIVADKLVMHEIAHMRHWGLLERAGRTGIRGNTWLVEGFARFSERLPIAMRLLNNNDPSRTGNIVLPMNPAVLPAYFFDDVPTYLQSSSSMYGGYGASSFVFDYFADQVALAGGDWWAAAQELLINGGVETDANTIVQKYLPGVTFTTLFTRARIALYTDDIGTPGLPAWTQYHQLQLRASRPPGSQVANDPRNLWAKIMPDQTFADSRAIVGGGAFGYVIDGTGASGNARIDFDPTLAPNGVMSITRIK